MSIHTLLASPVLTRVDTVEIEPEMVRGSRYFYPENARAYDDPRSHLHYDDAKAFFAYKRARYDIIISEPTNPWVSGVASLFTLEFYEEVKRYLAPNGVFAQWIQGYELSDELVVSVLSAVDRSFGDYVIYQIGHADWLILCFPSTKAPPLSQRIFTWPLMVRQLGTLGIDQVVQLDSLFSGNRELLHPLLRSELPNTDRFPVLDARAEEARFFRKRSQLLFGWSNTPVPFLDRVRPSVDERYPERDRKDLRDPHLLTLREQADWMLRAFQQPDLPLPKGINVGAMKAFLVADAQLGTDLASASAARYRRWLEAVVSVFQATAPYRRVHRSAWWDTVLRRSRLDASQTDPVAEQVALLDALDRRDLPRLVELWPLSNSNERVLPKELLDQVEAYLIVSGALARSPRGPNWLLPSENAPGYTWTRALRAYVDESSAP